MKTLSLALASALFTALALMGMSAPADAAALRRSDPNYNSTYAYFTHPTRGECFLDKPTGARRAVVECFTDEGDRFYTYLYPVKSEREGRGYYWADRRDDRKGRAFVRFGGRTLYFNEYYPANKNY